MKFLVLVCLFYCITFGEQSVVNPPEKAQVLKEDDIQLLQKIAELLQKNSALLQNVEATTSNNIQEPSLPASAEELEFLQKVTAFLQSYQSPSSLPEESKASVVAEDSNAERGMSTKAIFDVPYRNCPGYQARDAWGRCRSMW